MGDTGEPVTKWGPFEIELTDAWVLPVGLLLTATGVFAYLVLLVHGVTTTNLMCEYESNMRWSIGLAVGIGACCVAITLARTPSMRFASALLALVVAGLLGYEGVHLIYAAHCAHPVHTIAI
jgi:hypothetical protein